MQEITSLYSLLFVVEAVDIRRRDWDIAVLTVPLGCACAVHTEDQLEKLVKPFVQRPGLGSLQ